MNLVNNPYANPQVNVFGASLPASSTTTSLQGSNSHAELPVNVESDVDQIVQELHSPSKNPTALPKPKKAKEQKFTARDNMLLCTTWLQICSDPVVHTGQRKEGLRAQIEERYNHQKGEFPCRLNRALSSMRDKIRADVGKYSGYYARVLRENQSGLTNDDKVIELATTKLSIYSMSVNDITSLLLDFQGYNIACT